MRPDIRMSGIYDATIHAISRAIVNQDLLHWLFLSSSDPIVASHRKPRCMKETSITPDVIALLKEPFVNDNDDDV